MQYLDMQKQIIGTCKIIIKMKKNHFYNTMMLSTFMDLQCQNHYQLMILNG